MNVEVQAFSSEHRFLAQPRVTIDRIFDHVATGLGLANRQWFGLQVYNEWHQAVVWMKPSDSLSVAIEKGLRFKPMAIRFFLRAHSFPADFEEVRKDVAAMKLFYGQVTERFHYQGYNPNSEVELTLAGLVLLIEYGPLADVRDKMSPANLHHLVVGKLALLNNNTDLSIRVGKLVLQLWDLFGSMSADEAMFNYLNLVASAGYAYEKVRFTLKNHTEKKPADLEVSYKGIEIRQPALNGQIEYRSLPWTEISKINQRGQWLWVQLRDRTIGTIVFHANCQFAARRVHSLIKTYHGVHRAQRDGKQSASVARLTFSNPEQFFSGILRNMMTSNIFNKSQFVQETEFAEEQETEGAEQDEPDDLATINRELAAWIEANGANFDNEETMHQINKLFVLSNSIFEQLKSIKVYEDPNNQSKAEQHEIENSEQANSSMEPQVDSRVLSNDDDEPCFEKQQLEVPVDVHAEQQNDSEVMLNSSESGDDLALNNFSAKDKQKMVLPKESQPVVMSQVGECLNDVLEVIETGTEENEKTKLPSKSQPRNRFAGLRLSLFEH